MKFQSEIQLWEEYTLTGDRFFHQQQFKPALQWFHRALNVMEDLLLEGCQKNPSAELSAQIFRCFVISCHNLAYTSSQRKRTKETEHYYRYAYARLEQGAREWRLKFSVRETLMLELEAAYRRYWQFLSDQKRPIKIHVAQESLKNRFFGEQQRKTNPPVKFLRLSYLLY